MHHLSSNVSERRAPRLSRMWCSLVCAPQAFLHFHRRNTATQVFAARLFVAAVRILHGKIARLLPAAVGGSQCPGIPYKAEHASCAIHPSQPNLHPLPRRIYVVVDPLTLEPVYINAAKVTVLALPYREISMMAKSIQLANLSTRCSFIAHCQGSQKLQKPQQAHFQDGENRDLDVEAAGNLKSRRNFPILHSKLTPPVIAWLVFCLESLR
jgi:hypothetical protein